MKWTFCCFGGWWFGIFGVDKLFQRWISRMILACLLIDSEMQNEITHGELRSLPHELDWGCRAHRDPKGPNRPKHNHSPPYMAISKISSVALLDSCDFFHQIFCVSQKAFKNHSQIMDASHKRWVSRFTPREWPSEDDLATRNAGGGAGSGGKYAIVSIFGSECWEDGKALKDDSRFCIFSFRKDSHYLLGCRWLIFFLFYVFFFLVIWLWSAHTDTMFYEVSFQRSFLKMFAAFFLVAGVTVLPRWLESSGVKRGGTLDITSCLQRTDSAGCREWIRVMLYKRDVRVFDNWSRNAISYALALTCNYFQISSGKELFWHLVIAGHPVVVENMW